MNSLLRLPALRGALALGCPPCRFFVAPAALRVSLAWRSSPPVAPGRRSLSLAGPRESNQREGPRQHPISPRTNTGGHLSTSLAGAETR